MKKKLLKIGIAGNPNSGKTTIFNAITGLKQKVGNYPGVTVEKKEAIITYKNYQLQIFDLPGTYSLTAYSPDEVVARDFLLNEKPDLIIDILDSTNLERNLYLCLQLQELGIKVVGALNFSDEAETLGIFIDEKLLSDLLGIPFVKTIGTKEKGIFELLNIAISVFEDKKVNFKSIFYGNELEEEIGKLKNLVETDLEFIEKYPSRWIAIKLLEKDTTVFNIIKQHKNFSEIERATNSSVNYIAKHFGIDSEIVVSEQRYAYIHGAIKEAVRQKEKSSIKLTEIIDSVLLNKYLALPIFLVIIWTIFQLTFKIGHYPVVWLEKSFELISVEVGSYLPDGLLKNFIIDALIGGVGGVMSFVPLIVILFTLLSFLEDTGYIARAAFITDKFLHKFGLHGQSFMSMMLGFGCSVPAIMSTRTLKSTKDRLITAMIIPFMSCGARLPVYVLLSATFFPINSGNIVMLLYLIGIIIALISANIFRKFLFKGKDSPFVMELPPYRLPTIKGISWHVWNKTKSYFKKAGTLILTASILIWVLTTFPMQQIEDKTLLLENSYAGRFGKIIEPAIRPIGFDWKIGISLLTGFSAKEVVVSTLGVLYKADADNPDVSLRQALQQDKNFTPLTAFSLMLFVLIMPPCLAAIATLKNEIGWGWTAFSIFYSLSLAWLISFLVYQIGSNFIK